MKGAVTSDDVSYLQLLHRKRLRSLQVHWQDPAQNHH
jgi:hypothetical protein